MANKLFLHFFILIHITSSVYSQNCSNICLDFDPLANPTSDYVEPNSTPIANNDNFTIEARFSLPTTNTGSAQRRLLAFGGVNNRFELIEQAGILRLVRLTVGGSLALSTLSTTNFRDGAWHHVAASRNGALLVVYIDGAQAWNNNGFTGNLSTITFRVGAPAMAGASTTNSTWDGLIDEVRVWNTVRTASEIGGNYNCGLQGNETGLVLYYRFQEGVAGGNNPGVNVATDSSPNGLHGQLGTRFALTGNNSNWVCGDLNFQSCASNCAANFTFTTDGCGNAVFTNTTTAPGSVSWNFGDPNSGASNTSTQSNPTHQYAQSGVYTVCLTLSSPATGTCTTCKTVTVTVTDNQPPTINCKNAIVQFDYSNAGSPQTVSIQQLLDGAVTDNCCNNITVSVPFGQLEYNCQDACGGPRTVVLMATDCHGNSSSCTAQVLPIDQAPPIAICKDATLVLDASGMGMLQPNDIDGGSFDNCFIVQTSMSQGAFMCPPPGEPCPYRRTVTLTVADCVGNFSICTATVTIEERTPPIARCKDATIFLGPNGNATLQWTDIDNGSSDACQLGSISVGPINYNCPSGTQSCPYTTTVTLTAFDCSRNSASCTAQLTVSDNLAPVFVNCPANISVSAIPGQNSATVSWMPPTALDNCSASPIVTATHQSGAVFPCNNTTVTYTARDGCGNTATCSFAVTVNCSPDSCACSFGNVNFGLPPATQTVICGQSSFNLGCPQNNTYVLSGIFNCGPVGTNCTASGLTWNIVNSSNVSVASGTFTSGNFSISVNGNTMLAAGTYTMILTGQCGQRTCLCSIILISTGCGSGCNCGNFTNIALNDVTTTPPVGLFPMACGGSYNLACPVVGKRYQISYIFTCADSSGTGTCPPNNTAYSIVNTTTNTTVVPLTSISSGLPIPVDGNTIATPGVYEVTIQSTCGTRTCQCKIKLVVDCAQNCSCSFSNMEFSNGPLAQALICGQSTLNLKCTATQTYSIAGIFNCTPASCTSGNFSWNISSSTVLSVASGTYTPGAGGAFSFTFSGAPIATPGDYTLTISGTCGTSRCTCRILIKVSGCGACECGQFTGLTIGRKTVLGEPPASVSLACNQTATMPCPVKDLNWTLRGSFACVGDCQPTGMTWDIKNSAGTTVASGTMASSPFIAFFNGNSISTAGIYTLTLAATCGTQRCTCVVRLVVDCPLTANDLCGKAVVSCFSGFVNNNPSNGVADRNVLAVVDVRNHASAPLGANWENATDTKFMFPNWTSGNLGQIFGIDIDDASNIVYAASTTIYGRFLPNSLPNSTFGNVYKINASNGSITTLATLPQNVSAPAGLGDVWFDKNHNLPQGQLFVSNFYDGLIYRLDAGSGTTLSTFNFTGNPSNTLPNIEQGFAELGERVWALGIYQGRLFFSVWNEDRLRSHAQISNEIWSIALDATGNFSGSPVLEITMPVYDPPSASNFIYSSPVSDIEFTNDGSIIVAEKATYGDVGNASSISGSSSVGNWAHYARVFKFSGNSPNNWGTGKLYYVGNITNLSSAAQPHHANTAGGIDLGYESFAPQSSPNLCDSIIWSTGDALRFESTTVGWNGSSVVNIPTINVNDLVRSSEGSVTINDPTSNCGSTPYTYIFNGINDRVYGVAGLRMSGNSNITTSSNFVARSSIYIDMDNIFIPCQVVKTQYGDIETFKCLSCLSTPPCDSILASVQPVSPPDQRKDCCYSINLQNAYPNTFASIHITVTGAGLVPADVTPAPGWSIVSFSGGNSVELQHSSGYLPTGSFSPGTICLSNPTAAQQVITFEYWDAQDNVLCHSEATVECPFCMTVTQDSLTCDRTTGQLTMTFCIRTATTLDWNANSLIITPPAGTTINPAVFSLPNIPPGGTFCGSFLLNIPIGTDLDYGCFTFTLHEGNVVQGAPPKRCCMVDKCYDIPDCCPNNASIMPVDTSGGDCCWKITVNQPPSTAQFVTVNLIPNTAGVGISAVGPPTTGWNVNLGGLPLSTTFSLNPSGNLPATAVLPKLCFDVPDGSAMPQKLEIVWSTREAVLCYDTLEFSCKPQTDCADIDSLRLTCVPGSASQIYTIKITYTPPPGVTMPATHIAVVDVMPPLMTGTGIFPLGTPLNPGDMTTLDIPFNGPAGTEVCFNLNLYNRQENPLTIRECCVTETKHCFTLRNCIQSLRLVSVFPNPTQGNLVLQFDEGGSLPACSVRLRDVTGRLLHEEVIPSGSLRQEVQVPTSVQGLFFVELLQEERRVWTGKVVKQ